MQRLLNQLRPNRLIGRTAYPPKIADGRLAEYSRQESHDFPSKVRGLAVTPHRNAMMIDRVIIYGSSIMTIDGSCYHLIVSFNVTPLGCQVAKLRRIANMI